MSAHPVVMTVGAAAPASPKAAAQAGPQAVQQAAFGQGLHLPDRRRAPIRAALAIVVLMAIPAVMAGVRPASAGEINAPDRGGWQYGIDNGSSMVTFHTQAGIDFSKDDAAVVLGKSGIFMLGGIDSGLGTRISNANRSFLAQALGQPTASPAVMGGWLANQLNSLQVPAGLTFINGGDADRGAPETDKSLFDDNKVISFEAQNGNLRVNSIKFENFMLTNHINVDANNQWVVNPFIGSVYNNAGSVAIDAFIDNVFQNIDVTVKGPRNDYYLAGGGLIGLRSEASSAYIGSINGNYFYDISVVTQNITQPTVTSGGPGGSPYLEGGGLIGVSAVSAQGLIAGSAELDSLQYNYFDKIVVSSGDWLTGGGVVGASNNSQRNNDDTYVKLDYVNGNIFGSGADGSVKVTVRYSVRGGGVVGVNALSNASASISGLANNVFAGVSVSSGSYFRGGGVVGVQSKCYDTDPTRGQNNCDPNAPESLNEVPSLLLLAENNVFYNIKVEVAVGTNPTGVGLEGGGVIGVNAYNNSARIGEVRGGLFKNIEVGIYDTALASGELHGGGVIGVSALQRAELNNANDNYFDGIKINVGTSLFGGGIIGVATSSKVFKDSYMTYLGKVYNNTFKSIQVTAGYGTKSGHIYGGGIIGMSSEAGVATFLSWDDDYDLIAMDHNVFGNITVDAKQGIYGGGVIGHYVGSGYAFMGPINYSDFFNIKVRSDFIEGGGIIGAFSNDYAVIYSVDSSNFINNRITAERFIDGGGVIGVTGSSASAADPILGIHEIKNSYFLNNTVEAKNGIVMGGLVYSYGTVADGMLIEGSWFENNVFKAAVDLNTYDRNVYQAYAEKYGVYGTVTIDTGAVNVSNTEAVVRLASTPDSSVVFNNNIIEYDGGSRTNSLYFGGIPEYNYDNVSKKYVITKDPPAVDAKLVIDTTRGGTVALFDPILVDQRNSHRVFTMDVEGVGDFLWGGTNEVFTDAYYQATVPDNAVRLKGGSTSLMSGMSLTAANHLFRLDAGARLNVMGRNSLEVLQAELGGTMWFNLAAGTANDPATALLKVDSPDPVNVEGAVITLGDLPAGSALQPGTVFHLIDTGQYGAITTNQDTKMASARQGMLTRYNFTIDNDDDSDGVQGDRYLVARLVSYKPPAVGAPLVVEEWSQSGEPLVVYVKTAVDNPLMVEIKTAVDVPLAVYVKDPQSSANPPSVTIKDAVGDPLVVYIRDPQVSADPPVGYEESAVGNPLVVYVREPEVSASPPMILVKSETGDALYVLAQEFYPNSSWSFIDPNRPHLELYRETRLLTAGQAAAVGLLSQTWLIDHGYEAAETALGLTAKAWAPFAGVDYAMIRSGRETRIRTDSGRIMAGVAWRRPGGASVFTASIFTEGITGRYHLDADYGSIFPGRPQVRAKGDIEAAGVGLALRLKWRRGLQLEVSGRYGLARNEFGSPDFNNSLGDVMEYRAESPYWSVHAGAAYRLKLGDASSLDIVARYYFTRLESDRVTMGSGEVVDFKAVDSSRVRGGARFSSRLAGRASWYAGAYYEHELEGRSEGEHLGIAFETDELKGGTSVGELGVSFAPAPESRWNVEAGLEIYAGRNRGLSGGVRFGYEF